MQNAWFYMGKSFKIAFIAFVVFILQWIIFLSCKKSYRGDKIDNNSYVILFWHGRLALMPFAFRYFGKKGKRAYVMISRHKDGEQIAKIIKLFGLNTIRGSTSKGAATALRSALKVLDDKNDIIITPDGPRGPYRNISDGAVLLAQKKNVKIRLLHYEAKHFWKFKSWDKMILPKPFTELIYRLSEPLDISKFNKTQAKNFLLEHFKNIEKMDNF